MRLSEENKNDSKNYKWLLVIILPIIWGLVGLIVGKGFFSSIIENIKALLIIGAGILVLIGFMNLTSK